MLNWNKYLSTSELVAQNWKLNHLVEPIFEGANRFSVLGFEDDAQRASNKSNIIFQM